MQCGVAAILAERVSFRPEGFAILAGGAIEPAALAAVLQAVSGAAYQASPRQVARLAAAPAPATLGGARLLPAGRFGASHLMVVREAAAIAGPCPARVGALWDGRYRLAGAPRDTAGLAVGGLGGQASQVRRWSMLPDAVLRSLPAIRREGDLVAVPHILYPSRLACQPWRLVLSPVQPATGAQWTAA
jgi:tRNA(Ile)-lysidine synthase